MITFKQEFCASEHETLKIDKGYKSIFNRTRGLLDIMYRRSVHYLEENISLNVIRQTHIHYCLPISRDYFGIKMHEKYIQSANITGGLSRIPCIIISQDNKVNSRNTPHQTEPINVNVTVNNIIVSDISLIHLEKKNNKH
jgi:hypothetical protein